MSHVSEKFKKDYKNFDYANPRLQKEQKQKSLVRKRIILIGGTIVTFLILYALFFSPIFFISDIKIDGLREDNREAVNNIIYNALKEKKLGIFSKSHLLFLPVEQIKENIRQIILLDELDVQKNWPHGLTISVKEKNGALIWQNNAGCFLIDLAGTALRQCQGQNNYLTVKLINDNEPRVIGDKVIETNLILSIVELCENLKNIFGQGSAKFVEKENDYIYIFLENGPQLRFALAESTSRAVSRLMAIYNNEKYQESWSTLHSVDLRFGEKIYVK
ncbi:MAG: hypothetical protein WCT18_03780 [Patescibacteria group bacterium]